MEPRRARPAPAPWLLVAAAAALAGCGPWGPQGIFAGGPLAGEVAAPVGDWSFSDDHLTVAVETRGRWFRHSVTVLCIAHEGKLYLPSRHASRKRWVRNLLRDPRLRLRIGDRIYEGRAVRVRRDVPGLAAAFLRKYVGVEADGARFLTDPPATGDDRDELWLFRVDPPAVGEDGARSADAADDGRGGT